MSDLQQRYSSYDNIRLLQILDNKDEYTPEALAAVRAEVEKRNIGRADVDLYQQEKKLRPKRIIPPAVPLKQWEKALCFFGWFLPTELTGAELSTDYEANGFQTKRGQRYIFRIAGIFSTIIAVGISQWGGYIMLLLVVPMFYGAVKWLK